MKAFLMMVVVAAGVGATGTNDAKAGHIHGPVYGGPVIGGPVYGGPVYGGPVYGGPVYGRPVYRPAPAYVFDDCPHNYGYGRPAYGYGRGYGYGAPRGGVSIQTNGFGFSYWK